MAVEDVNAAGGINGKQVELFSEDDASSASQSAAAVTKMINQNKVVALVGAHNSACTLADLEVLNKYGVPMITPGSSAATVLNSGCQWISRAFPGDTLQCAALVNYIQKTEPAQKIGVIYVNDDYGKGGLDSITLAAASQVYRGCFRIVRGGRQGYDLPAEQAERTEYRLPVHLVPVFAGRAGHEAGTGPWLGCSVL